MKRSLRLATLLSLLSGLPALPAQVAPESAVAAPASISSMLQPSLEHMQTSLNALHLERWKISGELRAETTDNVGSIRRDLQETLPPLITAADAAPGSVSAVLPAFRNVDALYDVYLRIVQSARLAAPRPQADALEEARSGLEAARRALGERLQTTAKTQEQQTRDLRSVLSTRAVVPSPPASAPCPQTTPSARKKRRNQT